MSKYKFIKYVQIISNEASLSISVVTSSTYSRACQHHLTACARLHVFKYNSAIIIIFLAAISAKVTFM